MKPEKKVGKLFGQIIVKSTWIVKIFYVFIKDLYIVNCEHCLTVDNVE